MKSEYKSLNIFKGILQTGVGLGHISVEFLLFSFILFCFQEVLINPMLNAKTFSRLMSDQMLNNAESLQSKSGDETLIFNLHYIS